MTKKERRHLMELRKKKWRMKRKLKVIKKTRRRRIFGQ
jgi:hypothetical protein